MKYYSNPKLTEYNQDNDLVKNLMDPASEERKQFNNAVKGLAVWLAVMLIFSLLIIFSV